MASPGWWGQWARWTVPSPGCALWTLGPAGGGRRGWASRWSTPRALNVSAGCSRATCEPGGGILKDAPGEWRAGGWCGLDLPDAPGTREERRRPQIQLRRQPQVPLVPQGAPPGPRYWWCPGWLELPLEEQIPRDAWFFPKNVQKYVPDTWFVPLWSPSKQSGKDDPDCVQMVWRKRHIAECPGQPQIRGGTRALPARGG